MSDLSEFVFPSQTSDICSGVAFRQHAAVAAMQGLLVNGTYKNEELSREAVWYADSLIEELSK